MTPQDGYNRINVGMNKNHKILIVFVILAVVVAAVTHTSYMQKQVKPLFNKTDRTVLAKVTSFYGHDQNQVLILKVQDATNMMIEIYQVKDTHQSELKQKFDLNDDTDAYVTIDKSSTNLALVDVDKDGVLDIVAPTVDRNGNLRLNSFRYNNELQNFEVYQNPNID